MREDTRVVKPRTYRSGGSFTGNVGSFHGIVCLLFPEVFTAARVTIDASNGRVQTRRFDCPSPGEYLMDPAESLERCILERAIPWNSMRSIVRRDYPVAITYLRPCSVQLYCIRNVIVRSERVSPALKSKRTLRDAYLYGAFKLCHLSSGACQGCSI